MIHKFFHPTAAFFRLLCIAKLREYIPFWFYYIYWYIILLSFIDDDEWRKNRDENKWCSKVIAHCKSKNTLFFSWFSPLLFLMIWNFSWRTSYTFMDENKCYISLRTTRISIDFWQVFWGRGASAVRRLYACVQFLFVTNRSLCK
jgi:hypothetical protein